MTKHEERLLSALKDGNYEKDKLIYKLSTEVVFLSSQIRDSNKLLSELMSEAEPDILFPEESKRAMLTRTTKLGGDR